MSLKQLRPDGPIFFIQKGSLFPGGRVAAGEIDKICILPPVIIRYEKY